MDFRLPAAEMPPKRPVPNYRIEPADSSCFNSFVVGEFENPSKKYQPYFARPVRVGLFLALIVAIAFAWIWRVEMRKTAEGVGAELDNHRTRIDLNLRSPVAAIQNAKFLSGTSPSSGQFRQTLESLVKGDRLIRSLRILDSGGRELLTITGENRTATDSPARRSVTDYSEGFLEELRSLSQDELVISDFSTVPIDGRLEPSLLVGAGLFFPSGARAGFIVADVVVEEILSEIMGNLDGEDSEIFLVSPTGRWIYDSRREDPWVGLKDEDRSAWIADEFPEVWRAITSTADGSLADDEFWVFREHTPLQGHGTTEPQALQASYRTGGAVNARPFFIIKKIDGGPSWFSVWSAMVPIFLLFGLSMAILVPSLIRARRALQASENAARDLGEASLRTKMAMEAAQISEVRIDLDAGTINIDKRMEEMLLLRPGEKIRTLEQWEAKIHPQDRRKVIDLIEPLWREGEGTFRIRHRMRRGDESWGWFRFRGAVRLDEIERRKFILGAYIDLTEVIQRESELNRLEMATRQTLSGIAILDKEGRLEWSNQAFRNSPARSGETLPGEFIGNLLDLRGADADKETESIRRAILKGVEFSLIVTKISDDEEIVWVRVVGNPVLDGEGIPSHYVVIESDISKEKRAEADLRKSETLLIESQRLAGIGSWEIDLGENSVYWSDETFRIFGFSQDMTPHTDALLKLFGEEDREAVRRDLKAATEEGKSFQRRIGFLGANGVEKWILLRGMALRDDGFITKIYGVVQDISDQRLSEAALLKAKEEEEFLNDQLTEALDKARVSELKAREASEAKSSFLSMISHEIRNPLNGVIGMADLLKQTPLNEDQQSYLEAIHSSGTTVVMLLDDILDFNRLEHGKIEFEQRKFRIETVVEDSILIFSAKMAQKGLDVGFWIDPDVPRLVTGDITRVKQILFNLLGNAVKFTERGFITLTVELRERRPNDRCLLRFAVTDSGIGIPHERHDRIFQAFSQVDSSITRKFGGTGLGLAISRELALRMGGDIEFESQKNKGTRFEVILPFPASFAQDQKSTDPIDGRAIGWFGLEIRQKQMQTFLDSCGLLLKIVSSEQEMLSAIQEAASEDWVFIDSALLRQQAVLAAIKKRPKDARPLVVIGWPNQGEDFPFPVKWLSLPILRRSLLRILEGDAAHKEPDSKDGKSAEQQTRRTDLKILVAEDNAVNQKVIRLLLKRLGYGCEVAANGAIALEKARAKTFDLILMDIQMPEMDGIEASRQISSQLPKERRPRIVALTAGATRDNRQDAEEAGMSGYLTKPIRAAALEEELQATLDFLKQRSESETK